MISTSFWILVALYDFQDSGFFNLKFFTKWGVWATTLNFILLIIAQIRQAQRKKNIKLEPDFESYKRIELWQVCSYLSSMVFVSEILITLIYWVMMHGLDYKNQD